MRVGALLHLLAGAAVVSACLPAAAQGAAAAQANNPLANFTAFNLQDYYIGKLTDTDDNANQFWLRYARPFKLGPSNWLMRASLPVNTYPVGPSGGKETGLGDLNLFAAYLIDVGNPAVSFGIGPQTTLPTATQDGLGSDKYTLGLVNVLFEASSPKFQYGYLLSWQGSVGGSGPTDVNLGTFQPFLFYQLGGGNYLRAAPIWAYNFENSTYGMPLGIGFGHVIISDKVVYNLFVEPQWSFADKGPGWPQWQIFLGFNMQFKN
ncbi:MAG: hypothetical protein M9915_11275 [Rhizobacter sp.]|nr:hypothetical protein [Rhizobacter sp.]